MTWQFWIDRGGTFTDIVALSPEKKTIVRKLLSEDPERYDDATVQGIREIMEIPQNSPISIDRIKIIKMGTTVATNALLERKGDRTVLVITKGFADALRIGYQNRPNIFARQIVLPEMLYDCVVEVEERYDAKGNELISIDTDRVRQDLQAAYDDGIRSCAIVLMHGYRYPKHEKEVATIALDIKFTQISVSHQVSPLIKLVSRGDTTVVDAYLSPILRRYVDRVAVNLSDRSPNTQLPKLMFMQSNGGLVDANYFQGKDSILSGPAGGIVGAVKTCQLAGFNKIIGFDMGGTSTDVSHFAGEYERSFETEVAGVRMRTPMMSIHTVAAGGGSLLQFDGSRYRVGPESAGANPGPAAYSKGGGLTVTDCNVMVGKLQPEFFPKVFGVNADLPLNVEIVAQKFSQLAQKISDGRTIEQIASAFLAIAVEKMAQAIAKISLQRGYDVSEYTLCCFGGAGGQHACLIADALGIKQIFIHPYAGVLSAYGIGLADIRVLKERSIEGKLEPNSPQELAISLTELINLATEELQQQQEHNSQEIQILQKVHLKYEGTDSAIIVNFDRDLAVMKQQFEQIHRQSYGFIVADKNLIVETISVELICPGSGSRESGVGCRESVVGANGNSPIRVSNPKPISTVKIYTADRWYDAPVYRREQLRSRDVINSPAIIVEETGTNIIEPGWTAEVSDRNDLIIKKITKVGTFHGTSLQKTISKPDPVQLEIFNNLFRAIAEQMGLTLQNTSYSVNIKERLDFSCAIFDREGNLVANAPHIPVHLGSMSESVRSLIETVGDRLQPGDVYVQNNPYNGGTHLPDITVITPVFLEEAGGFSSPASSASSASRLPQVHSIVPKARILAVSPNKKRRRKHRYYALAPDSRLPIFYVASRGHHADIGGITPGSMPPHSKTIEEEGILIDNFLLVDRGNFRERELLELLTNNPYPVRNSIQNIADLKAQIAANNKGVKELLKMVEKYGLETTQAYMGFVQNNAEESVRRVIDVLRDGNFCCELDTGGKIQVEITINKKTRSAKIDFTGTSPQLNNNSNAPTAVCKAAVLYVFRSLVDDDIPLNAGCLKPLEIIIPESCMLNPKYPAAVVAGNVETSQNITDCIYGALGVMSASQGTMNNFTFGNEKYQYYETICGGSGAGANFDGTDAIQTHMTNSRLTDPEVLELRFPVLLESFKIRPESGGGGKHRGGNGVVRKIRFLESMTAGILSSRRKIAPFGLNGGESGAVGKNYVERNARKMEALNSTATVEMNAGDIFAIETPGGGGYGK
jgi:5-oxoprolinase (ATP-hydrolysing)